MPHPERRSLEWTSRPAQSRLWQRKNIIDRWVDETSDEDTSTPFRLLHKALAGAQDALSCGGIRVGEIYMAECKALGYVDAVGDVLLMFKPEAETQLVLTAMDLLMDVLAADTAATVKNTIKKFEEQMDRVLEASGVLA